MIRRPFSPFGARWFRRRGDRQRQAKSQDIFGSVSALSSWLEGQSTSLRERSASPVTLRRWLVTVSGSIWQLSRYLEPFSVELDKKTLARLSGDPTEAELAAMQTRAAALRKQALELYQGTMTALEAMSRSPSLADLVALEGQIQSQLNALSAQIGVFLSDWMAWQGVAIEALARSASPEPAGWRALGWLATLGRAALILALGAPLLLIPSLGIRLYGTLAFIVLLYVLMASFQGRWASCPVCGELVGPFFSEEKIKTCGRCRQRLVLRDDRVHSIRGLTQEGGVSGESVPFQ